MTDIFLDNSLIKNIKIYIFTKLYILLIRTLVDYLKSKSFHSIFNQKIVFNNILKINVDTLYQKRIIEIILF